MGGLVIVILTNHSERDTASLLERENHDRPGGVVGVPDWEREASTSARPDDVWASQ